MGKKGFDTEKYMEAQIGKILERVEKFDKLYLEFGGKLYSDNHASRVLPGFEKDTKVRMLQKLGDRIEIVHCISAKDIEKRKMRRDFGLAYDDQILKDISDLRGIGVDVSAVVINRFSGEKCVEKFKRKLENRGIRVFVHRELPDYTKNIDLVVSDSGYGSQDYVETKKGIVVVTAPGPGSGKMSFCMSQVYNDRKRGIKSGFAKFETFPIWNLPLEHPVNVAYEAATADIGDYNMLDSFHKKEYGVEAVNYNRDVENFSIMKKMIDEMVGKDDPMAQYKSPTDMGVNMAKDGIVDNDVVEDASREEIIRRYFRYHREFVEGETTIETIERIEKILEKSGLKPEDRMVVMPARKAAEEARSRKGYRGVFCGSALQISGGVIVTGKNSDLMHAESAMLLNAAKEIAGVDDSVDVISRDVIESLRKLKSVMGMSSTSLDVKETLDALASSAVSDKNATKCMEALKELSGCEMHTTHMMDSGDEIPLGRLGLNVTTDARLPFSNNNGC